jgi:hypothetical protein
MMAAGGGHIKSVAILLAAGADRDVKDKVSAVHDAAENFVNFAFYLMSCHVMSCYVSCNVQFDYDVFRMRSSA